MGSPSEEERAVDYFTLSDLSAYFTIRFRYEDLETYSVSSLCCASISTGRPSMLRAKYAAVMILWA